MTQVWFFINPWFMHRMSPNFKRIYGPMLCQIWPKSVHWFAPAGWKIGKSNFNTGSLIVRVIVYRYKRESLQILGSVGEPINPEAWLWYHHVVGDGRCAIVDTFWQTETVICTLKHHTICWPVRTPTAILSIHIAHLSVSRAKIFTWDKVGAMATIMWVGNHG